MGTRLLSESLIRKRFPHIRYVRIHSVGKHMATIYAWNDQLRLEEEDRTALKRFAATDLAPYVCFKVKEYSKVLEENVPRVDDVPDHVLRAAMNRSLDLQGIVGVMNEMFSSGRIAFSEYNPWSGMIHWSVNTPSPLTEIEKELIHRYLYELVPLGATFEIQYAQEREHSSR